MWRLHTNKWLDMCESMHWENCESKPIQDTVLDAKVWTVDGGSTSEP